MPVAQPGDERRGDDGDDLGGERLVPEHLAGTEPEQVEQAEVDDERDAAHREEPGDLVGAGPQRGGADGRGDGGRADGPVVGQLVAGAHGAPRVSDTAVWRG